jgi:type IV pilus assembly protein PilM
MSILNKSVVGLEINSNEIRGVQMEGSADKPYIRSFGRYPLSYGTVKDGKVVKPSELGAALKKLWNKANFKCRNVIIGISNQDVIVRFASFPKVPKDKLDSMIRFQSEDYIPIPLDEIELDYAVTGESASEQGTNLIVLLVAARKQMLFDYISAMDSAGLNVADIGVSTLSLELLIPKELRKFPVAAVNLSIDGASILIMNNGVPGMARAFVYSTEISGCLHKLSGLDPDSEYSVEEEELDQVCSFIAKEIRSSVLYYQNQNPGANVQNLVLTGSLARTLGFVERMRQILGISVELAGKIQGLTGAIKDYKGFRLPDYAVCSSLAIRGLGVTSK